MTFKEELNMITKNVNYYKDAFEIFREVAKEAAREGEFETSVELFPENAAQYECIRDAAGSTGLNWSVEKKIASVKIYLSWK